VSVLALSGGIGGAKLALGLYRVLPPGGLTVIANTGDDFEHLGLAISPDIDTLLYTLAGIDNPELGWGRRGETWTFMTALEALGGETWFKLGDGDLATHIERTRRLAAGESLSQITDDFCRRLGISARLLPMTDDRVRTRLRAEEGWLDFQDYFVRQRCTPAVREIAFAGADEARPQPQFLAALSDRNLHVALDRATAQLGGRQSMALSTLENSDLVRDVARRAKMEILRDLGGNLKRFESQLLANGAQVHWAEDGRQANRIILEIAKRFGLRVIGVLPEEFEQHRSRLVGSSLERVNTGQV